MAGSVPVAVRWMWIVGILATVLSLANDVRGLAKFMPWALADSGSTSALNDLVKHGLFPNVDFGYTYGPLSVVWGWLWASIFGNSYLPAIGLLILLKILISFTLLRIFSRMTFPIYIGILIGAGPILYCRAGEVFPISAEQLMLLLAIRSFQLNRPRETLIYLTIAVGFRPAAGLFCGLAAVLWIARSQLTRGGDGVVGLVKVAYPAVLVLITVAVAYISLTSFDSYRRTVLPFAGAKMYSNMEGGSVWTDGLTHFISSSPSLKEKFLQTSWLNLGCLLLIPFGLFAMLQRSPDTYAQRALIASLALLIPALLLTYGGKEATVYQRYRPFFWVCGMSSLVLTLQVLRGLCWAIVPVFGSGLLVRFVAATANVFHGYPGAGQEFAPGTFLTLPTEAHDELKQISGIVASQPVRIFDGMGDVTLMRAYGIQAPLNRYWCLRDGLNIDREVEHIREDLASSRYILTTVAPNTHRDRYRDAFAERSTLIFAGKVFELYRTDPPRQP